MNITQLDLDDDQRRGLDLALGGENLFLTGAAGSGKSALMSVLVRSLAEDARVVALTASTGIAALNIGGRTIHSFLGTKICQSVSKAAQHLDKMRQEDPRRLDKLRWRLTGTDVIVVDEVSMLTGDYIDMIDWWLRALIGEDTPFARKQVVFVGDFFQLPPVIKRDDHVERELAFEANAWREAGVRTALLSHNHRQEQDQPFKDALDSLRTGTLAPRTAAFFAQCVGRALDEPTVLFPTNQQVARVNRTKLAALPGVLFTLRAKFSGPEWARKQLARFCFTEQKIDLKECAEVLLTRNVYDGGSGEEYFVNGDRGTLVRGDGGGGDLRVCLERDDGREVDVKPKRFELRGGSNDVIATMTQYPVKLSYAISIHKSQGMTLSRVRCDLRRCFADGQAYTALSRARTINGLSLARPLNPESVFAHRKCVAFYGTGGKVRFVEKSRRAVSA